ncbi:lipopolysaccharide biosynthesis protein [Beijerinckia indica]|uniref:Membrane protein involved in the export of O-antigen and teichoic acid-like protein n=1 Tax=Beijerinckia indica subsp. indica (strain ATCC 9039 / DSM 1715 / NCIMB 8712) TaxID=395963 RepID=B2IFV8_BEII9|nr:teichoic acid transporter [Beijerinckia indica]ACB95697.1 membrane protein involved in the export of O-antigen and teichoic acid-like protein [Beijerinckia indica subsp. indica ATCC 9039]
MTVFLAFLCNILFNFAIGLLIAKFLGPEEYGRFALSHATAIAVQTAFFDWIRLGATRFYSQRSQHENPALRPTLDVSFSLIGCAIAIGGGLLMLSGVHFTLSNPFIGLALAIAIANGLFDYHAALARARFHDQHYVRLILVKTFLGALLMGGAAFWFNSAMLTLVGATLSLGGAVLAARSGLPAGETCQALPQFATASALVRYSLPIVCANLLYLSIPLANRSLIAIFYGFSETGQFSLAFDFGTKAIQAIGSALDVVLFQIAVATHELLGPSHGRQRLANNIAIIFSVVLASCTGLWLTLPSIEGMIVPNDFRGPFYMLLPLMLTGLFCSALIQFAITPIFQIEKRTVPLIAAAFIGCLVDPILVYVLPRNPDASSLAIAQAGAMLAALIALITFAAFTKPQWPRWRDLAIAMLATALMSAALLPLRSREPGLATLTLQIGIGLLVYATVTLSLDFAGLRGIIMARLRT